MDKNSHGRSLLEAHIAFIMLGFTGLFPAYLKTSPAFIICGRALFACLALLAIVAINGQSLRLPSRSHVRAIIMIGVIFAFHWFCFFYSIQLSSVAIGLITFSTYSLFTCLLEPLFLREKLRPTNLFFAAFTLVGVYLAIGKIDFSTDATKGAIWGMVSALTCAIVVILNRKYVQTTSCITISFYEFLVVGLVFAPSLPFIDTDYSPKTIGLIALLGIVFTAISHTLMNKAMKHVRAQTVSVLGSLEVVYGMILAALFLGEHPTTRSIIGGVIVVCATALTTGYSVGEARTKQRDPVID